MNKKKVGVWPGKRPVFAPLVLRRLQNRVRHLQKVLEQAKRVIDGPEGGS